jgi:hypothetical protein
MHPGLGILIPLSSTINGGEQGFTFRVLGGERKAPASNFECTTGGEVLAEDDVIGKIASGAAELATEDSPLGFAPGSRDERARTAANPKTPSATAEPITIGLTRALGAFTVGCERRSEGAARTVAGRGSDAERLSISATRAARSRRLSPASVASHSPTSVAVAGPGTFVVS